MKNLLLAIVLVVLPTTSQAAVTINFTGATFAYEEGSSLIGSSKQVETSSEITREIQTDPQMVTGSIVIDTALAGANMAIGPDVLYRGDAFVTLTFASAGYTPVQLTGTLAEQQIDNSAESGLTFLLADAADTYAYQFQLFSLSDIPTDIFGGLLLPDFTKADNLFFAAVSRKLSGAVTTQYLSAGAVTSIDQVATAVPEPATWAMMLVGFGLVGAGMRQRKRVAVRFAC